MAADWIKMRVDLLTHPKIVRILSATRTDKFRVVGGLHAVWSIFDTHSVDGQLKGYTPELLDHVIGWEGFARAMESVGWLTFDGLETLALPEFDAHNGQSAKRRAEDQKRKRDGRNRPQSVPDDCGQNADKMRTREREEKRREEKEENKGNAFALPDWLPADAWQDWHDYRNSRKGWTAKAKALSLQTLSELHAQGHDPRKVIDQAIERGWTGLFPVRGTTEGRQEPPRRHKELA